MDLPPGLQTRPLTMDDAVPVANLVRASEVHDVGEALIDDEDIVGDWQRPSFDLASQSVDLLDNGTLIAFAGVFKGRYADTTVHPDHRGRGIGTALAGWTQARARVDGARSSVNPCRAVGTPSACSKALAITSVGSHGCSSYRADP